VLASCQPFPVSLPDARVETKFFGFRIFAKILQKAFLAFRKKLTKVEKIFVFTKAFAKFLFSRNTGGCYLKIR
jgi:hypothetical protein